MKQLVRRGDLEGVETHLGWLIKPESVDRVANERLAQAEKRVSSLKSASSWSESIPVNAPVRGRAAQGKSLRSKSGKSGRGE